MYIKVVYYRYYIYIKSSYSSSDSSNSNYSYVVDMKGVALVEMH